jgi:hypothetical protein
LVIVVDSISFQLSNTQFPISVRQQQVEFALVKLKLLLQQSAAAGEFEWWWQAAAAAADACQSGAVAAELGHVVAEFNVRRQFEWRQHAVFE